MNDRVIAVDVDDVCANLIGEWVRRYNVVFNDCVLPEHIRGWNIAEYLPKATKEEVFGLLDTHGLYDCVLPMTGSRPTVDKLREHGRVVFVTSCHEGKGADAKFNWLRRWGFISEPRDFIAAKDKALIKADYLFDDCPANVEGFPGIGVLVNHFHNINTQVSVPRLPFIEAPAFVSKVRPLK